MTTAEPEPPYCQVQVYAASYGLGEPPEYCLEPCDPGFDMCPAHLLELQP